MSELSKSLDFNSPAKIRVRIEKLQASNQVENLVVKLDDEDRLDVTFLSNDGYEVQLSMRSLDSPYESATKNDVVNVK